MQFAEFAERAGKIETLSGDHEKVKEVASLLSDADEVRVVARFVQGRVFPAWDDRKLDVGPSLLYDALALAGDSSADGIEESVAEKGDIGDVARGLGFGGQQTFGSTAEAVSDVYDGFESLASKEGEGSLETKTRELGRLFMDSSPCGAKYLARLVLGEMRLGVGEGTVRDAVVSAFDADAELVERGIMLTNDVGEVAEVARDEGEEGLASLEMVVGRPVKPMLAQTTTVENVFTDLDADEAFVQTKYDGARLQAHLGDGTRLFSRSLEDLTDSLPDVVETVEDVVGDDRLILDAEVVAVGDDGPLPFQEVLRRIRRKHRIEEMRDEVELELYVFDVLYDGEDSAVIDETLEERHQRLVGAVDDEAVARTAVVEGTEGVHDEEAVALDAGHEGVVVKHPESAYSPGRRGKNWLKIKPEPETLDLVVTGGEWGEGRRASLVGSYLLSVRGEDGYETVGKVATGLTDEKLEELTERFIDGDLVVSEDGKEIEFKPDVVFEVGCEEIQRSPVYTSGYALRFPRFLGVRDDKSAEEADTLERLERLHEDEDD
ncbi:MAG: ATP-dependent DNA ligase [Halobacteriales archaeon]|nr:ATP-dependent DNA ligase [Halobacteriales archaeon]